MKTLNNILVYPSGEKKRKTIEDLIKVTCLSTSLLLPLTSFGQTQRVVTPIKYNLDGSLINEKKEGVSIDVIIKTGNFTQSEEQARKRKVLNNLYINILESKRESVNELNLELYELYCSFMRDNFNTNVVQTESFKDIERYLRSIGFKVDNLQF